MSGTTHIIGAGLAGLSTAVRLTERGVSVALHEAAGQAGGRCRSFEDARLERRIDNGNHLVLSGNHAVRRYLATTGGRMVPGPAAYPFVDLASGERWEVRLNRGPLPWWAAVPSRRIAGTGLADYLGMARLGLAGERQTVAEAIRDRGPIWTRFWEPITLAVLNTPPERGQARLLWRVMRETFLLGAERSRPMFAPEGLGAALVEPALDWLARRKVVPSYSRTLREIARENGRVSAVTFSGGETLTLGPADRLVLALPPSRLRPLLPELTLPEDDASILNAHFTLEDPALLAGKPEFIGTISSQTHWIFVREDVISLTISAADALGLGQTPAEEIVPKLWDEVVRALGLPAGTRYHRVRMIRERRATFDQSPAGVAKRPSARTPLRNLVLAGDATATGLPATIEGAIRSGETAARLTLGER